MSMASATSQFDCHLALYTLRVDVPRFASSPAFMNVFSCAQATYAGAGGRRRALCPFVGDATPALPGISEKEHTSADAACATFAAQTPTLNSCRDRRALSGALASARGRAQCLQAIEPQRRQGTRCARGPTGDGVTSPINPLYTLDSGLCPLASPTPRTTASSRNSPSGSLSLILPISLDIPTTLEPFPATARDLHTLIESDSSPNCNDGQRACRPSTTRRTRRYGSLNIRTNAGGGGNVRLALLPSLKS